MTCNFSIRTRTSALPPIVSHTGSRKARFTSLPFDSPTLYLNIYARNGNRIARRGCDFIGHHGIPKPNVSIMSVSLVRWNAGLMWVTARVFCDVTTARQSLQKGCVTLMVTESCKIAWIVMPNHEH